MNKQSYDAILEVLDTQIAELAQHMYALYDRGVPNCAQLLVTREAKFEPGEEFMFDWRSNIPPMDIVLLGLELAREIIGAEHEEESTPVSVLKLRHDAIEALDKIVAQLPEMQLPNDIGGDSPGSKRKPPEKAQ